MKNNIGRKRKNIQVQSPLSLATPGQLILTIIKIPARQSRSFKKNKGVLNAGISFLRIPSKTKVNTIVYESNSHRADILLIVDCKFLF